MAAAIVPILSSLIPALIPAIVSAVEKLFGNGTGPKKMDAAQSLLTDLFKRFQDAFPGTGMPLGDELQKMIQAEVERMNREGALKGTDTVLTVAKPGTTISSEVARGMDLMLEGALVVIRAERTNKT